MHYSKTHHITVCCVQIICQTFQSKPLHWQLGGTALTVVVPTVDFLRKPEVCNTHVHVLIQPKGKFSWLRKAFIGYLRQKKKVMSRELRYRVHQVLPRRIMTSSTWWPMWNSLVASNQFFETNRERIRTKEVRKWLCSDGLLGYAKWTQVLSVVSKIIIRGHLKCSLLPPRPAPCIGHQKK